MDRQQRADVLVDDSGVDPRTPVDLLADEREMLLAFVRRHRETLELKCAGLTPQQLAARATPPSTVSLLGLVRHMARVEQGWFRQCLEGAEVARHYRWPGNWDGEWDDAVGTQECVDDAFATWRSECRHSDLVVARHELTDTFSSGGDEVWSVRALLLHMLEEYARHNGHADVLREALDGRVGV